MTTNQHHPTPGPWHNFGPIIHAAGDRIATVAKHGDEYTDTDMANARLLTAAPKLLTVARGCLGYFRYLQAQNSPDAPDDDWLEPLIAAIADAEGGKLE